MSQEYNWTMVPTTFLVAFVLTLLPMPGWAIWCRPAWLLMVLIYWVMMTPYRINLGAAWLIGIMLDVLNGTLLGEHALAMTVVAYLVAKMDSRFRMSSLVQQSLSVFVLVLIYQFILFCIQGFLGELPAHWLYWSPALSSMILWPWIYGIIRSGLIIR